MRNGVYALLAVVMGVALIGVLPGQLSDLTAPTMETASLQGVSKAAAVDNSTLTNSAAAEGGSGENVTILGDALTVNEGAVIEEGTMYSTARAVYDPYADVMYYGSWGVGLMVALGVYFLAKRMLG